MNIYQTRLATEAAIEAAISTKNFNKKELFLKCKKEIGKNFQNTLWRVEELLTSTEKSSYCQEWRKEKKKEELEIAFEFWEDDRKRLLESVELAYKTIDSTEDEYILEKSYEFNPLTLTSYYCGRKFAPEEVYTSDELASWRTMLDRLPEQINEMEEMYHYIKSHLDQK